MPKREKTPPPAADEPKYLTIVHPYPPHANLELEGERKELAYWLASCTGKDPLLAFFYKPQSPDMIIVEVAREFQHWDHLLGAHPWSTVFQNPSPQYKDNVSKIFYCTFSTGRQVQKYGWKRVNVEERWFLTWSPFNRLVTFPYPRTIWCHTPPEDATNAPLCRPLPVSYFPPPDERSPLPPVGAQGWQEARTHTAPKPNHWGRGPTKNNAQNVNRPLGTPLASTSPPANTANRNGARPSAWGPTNTTSPIAAPAPMYGAPPGLPPLQAGVASTPSGTYHTAHSSAWTVTSGSTRASSPAGSDSDGGSIGGTPTQSEFHDVESVIAPDVADLVGELNVEEHLWETATDDWNSGPYSYDETYTDPVDEEPPENLWADYVAPAPEVPKDAFLCTTHGKLCPKGICKDYRRHLREVERKKQDEERAAALASKKHKKKTTQAKRPIMDRPPHLMNGGAPPAPRSESGSETPSAHTAPEEDSPPTSEPEKLEFNARTRPPHLMAGAAAQAPGNPSPLSPTSSSSSSSRVKAPPAPPPRARPAHLMKGASGVAKAASTGSAKPEPVPLPDNGWAHISRGQSANGVPAPGDDAKSSTGGWGHVSNGPWGGGGASSKGKGAARPGPGPSARAPPSDSGWGHVPRAAGPSPPVGNDAKSAMSSTGGWGRVSNGPWGDGGGASGKGKGAAKAPSVGAAKPEPGPTARAPPADDGWGHVPRTGGAPAKANDAKSALSSTGGWGQVSNGPWGGSAPASAKGNGKSGKGKVKASGQGGRPQPQAQPQEAASAPKKSWADQMEDDDGQSVVSSWNGGWGNVSNGPY